MTLPCERTRSIKALIDFRRKIALMTLTEIRKHPRELRDESVRIGRHLCSSDLFDYYYKEKE